MLGLAQEGPRPGRRSGTWTCPGIYLYWVLELVAVFSVLGALALRRPPLWRVTQKRSVASAHAPPTVLEPISLALLVDAYLPDVLAGNGHDVRWGPSGPGTTARVADVLRPPV